MVLLWRSDSQEGSSYRTFDGSSDILMFLFYFEPVGMRGKQGEEKAFELLAYLYGKAFEFFFERFTTGGELTRKGSEFPSVKQEVIDEIEGKKEG